MGIALMLFQHDSFNILDVVVYDIFKDYVGAFIRALQLKLHIAYFQAVHVAGKQSV